MKRLIFILIFVFIFSCYGNENELYRKNIDEKIIKVYDVDKIEGNILVLISKDLKEVKKIKKSSLNKEVKEGDKLTYFDGEVYINNNRELKNKISEILYELNKENKVLSLKL